MKSLPRLRSPRSTRGQRADPAPPPPSPPPPVSLERPSAPSRSRDAPVVGQLASVDGHVTTGRVGQVVRAVEPCRPRRYSTSCELQPQRPPAQLSSTAAPAGWRAGGPSGVDGSGASRAGSALLLAARSLSSTVAGRAGTDAEPSRSAGHGSEVPGPGKERRRSRVEGTSPRGLPASYGEEGSQPWV